MTRRDFLGGALASAALAPTTRPNVLFLSVDDMNDWIGCLRGYPGVSTPNIDRLAKRGVLFSDTHCAAPLCNPSRTALFTGLRPSTSGIYDNDQYWRPALPDVATIPMYFRQHGYYAAGAGKVLHHVAGFNPPDQWNEFQLQQFDDPWYRRADWYPWNQRIPAPKGHPFNGINNFPGEFDWGVLEKPEDQYGDQKAVAFAEGFLKRSHDKPFFLAVGMWHPHIPMYSPQNYWDLYPDGRVRLPETREDDLDDVPPIGRKFAAARREEFERILKEGKWKEFVHAYLAAVSFADALAGRVLRALEQSAYARNTIIVFWSDNGWHLGEKRHVHKSTLWQRSTHVPMIFAGPGTRAAGVTRPQTVNLLDIYPTLVEMCGLPVNPRLEGTSLVPLLRDSKAKRNPTLSTFLPGNHAVVSERWRYIVYSDGGEELYDRKADPNEFTNLAGRPELAPVKRDLARYAPKTSAPPKPSVTEYDFDFQTYTYTRKPAPISH
jgi:arylsulfatase A-like enzyme